MGGAIAHALADIKTEIDKDMTVPWAPDLRAKAHKSFLDGYLMLGMTKWSKNARLNSAETHRVDKSANT